MGTDGDLVLNPTWHGQRRIAFWVGLGLLVGGLGIAIWLAWQFWGTNWLSERAQRHEVMLFEQDHSGRNASGPAALLEIPRFGPDYVVPINDGTTPDLLSKGVGHFTGTGPLVAGKPTTVAPGSVGNYALAGHRITHGQPFARLPQLRPGDRVYVVTHTLTYVYVLDTDPNELVVPFTAGWVLAEAPINPDGGPQARQGRQERTITLTTCAELFHTDLRMIAFGHLDATYPTDPANPTGLAR